MVLPVTLEIHKDEAPISLVARLAAANGFPSLRAFLDHTEVTAGAIVKGDPASMALVSQWSSIPVEQLGDLTSRTDGVALTWQLGRAILNKEMRPGRLLRYCPECVMDDQRLGAGRVVARAYYRAWWAVRGIEGCHIHDRKLTEVAVFAGEDIHDFTRHVEMNMEFINKEVSAPSSRTQPCLDRYLLDGVFGNGQLTFLGGIDTHVVAEFSRYLGDLLSLHDVRHWMPDGQAVSEWGFLLVSQGEATVRDVIAEVIDRSPPKKNQFGAVLGPMLPWLRRNLSKATYQPIVELVQDILERNIPFRPGDTILKPVKIRHLYSVTMAQEEFGLHPRRIRTLMQELFTDLRADRPDGQTYFDAATAEPVLRAAADTLTSRQAADELGLTEARMQDLLDAGIIHQVERRGGGERAYTRIRRSAVSDFEGRLVTRISAVESDVGLRSLASAASTWHRRFHNLVSMILDGTLDAFVIAGSSPLLQRVRVRSDGPPLASGPPAGVDNQWMGTKEVERVLGTTTATVSELIERGYLRVRFHLGATGRTVKLVERQSLLEFMEDHASLSEIAKCRHGFRAAIKAELDAAGIAPIFEPTGFIARFYRRSDLTKIG